MYSTSYYACGQVQTWPTPVYVRQQLCKKLGPANLVDGTGLVAAGSQDWIANGPLRIANGTTCTLSVQVC